MGCRVETFPGSLLECARDDDACQSPLLKALRQKSRELDVLRRISETISCTLDQEAVLKPIIDLVVEVTRGDGSPPRLT